jgi:hypothetical protein
MTTPFLGSGMEQRYCKVIHDGFHRPGTILGRMHHQLGAIWGPVLAVLVRDMGALSPHSVANLGLLSESWGNLSSGSSALRHAHFMEPKLPCNATNKTKRRGRGRITERRTLRQLRAAPDLALNRSATAFLPTKTASREG